MSLLVRDRSRRTATAAALVFIVAALLAGAAEAQSLRGSSASLDRQNRQANVHDFTRLRDRAHVQRFLDAGLLVRVHDGRDFWLKDVSFPVARPAVRLFIQRLANQYRAACGERLVVTSLTRPTANQPRNASRISVHPTGMAFDMRRSWSRRCRGWPRGCRGCSRCRAVRRRP